VKLIFRRKWRQDMKFRLLAGLAFCSLGAVANAHAAPGVPNTPSDTVQLQAKKVDPLAACLARVTRTADSVSATLKTGAKFEFKKDSTGRPESFIYTAADGQQQISQVSDIVQKLESEKANIPDEVKTSVAYIELRKRASLSFKRFLNESCKHTLVSAAPASGTSRQGSVIAGLGPNPTPMDEDDGYWPEFDEWAHMTQSDFEYMADDMISESFESDMTEYVLAEKQIPMPKCIDAIASCKDTCQRTGAYGAAGVCAPLGTAAGAVLTPGIGAAVFVLCGGKVFQATEKCRGGCEIPAISCTR
jgi:hypothetical protein